MPTGLFRVLPWHPFSFSEKGPGDEAPAEGDHPKNLTALPPGPSPKKRGEPNEAAEILRYALNCGKRPLPPHPPD